MAIYTVGDNITLQSDLTMLSDGSTPNYVGATMTITVVSDGGVRSVLSATAVGTPAQVEATFAAPSPGNYQYQAHVTLATGKSYTQQPPGRFQVVAAL